MLRNLVLSANRGSEEAFSELYEKYFTPIFRYLYYRTGSREDAEDIAQAVFLKVYEKKPGEKVLRAYFFTVARNAAIDYWRKKKTILLENAEEIAGHDSPADSFRKTEAAEFVNKITGFLPDEQREAIILRFINELSYPEIAELLNKNESAVRQIVCRGLKKLREINKK